MGRTEDQVFDRRVEVSAQRRFYCTLDWTRRVPITVNIFMQNMTVYISIFGALKRVTYFKGTFKACLHIPSPFPTPSPSQVYHFAYGDGKMGSTAILPVRWLVTVGTMLNFVGDEDGMCEQAFTPNKSERESKNILWSLPPFNVIVWNRSRFSFAFS